MGYVVPITLVEALPGDTFQHSISALLRVTPLAKPVMHPVDVTIQTYFVPHRILWGNWEPFITQKNPSLSVPTITLTGSGEGMVDRLGVPPTAGLEINALPVRAYNMIWNEFIRDPQLQTVVSQDQTGLLRPCWNSDYFNTCRPNAQQGEGAEQVEFPISGIGIRNSGTFVNTPIDVVESNGELTQYASQRSTAAAAPNDFVVEEDPDQTGVPNIRGTFDVNQQRLAYSVQRWREKRNRFGDRYSDLVRAMGVNIGDARLQRPERIASASGGIAFSEVLSTANTTGDNGDELGALGGHGISGVRSKPYRYFCKEHGYIISLMVVRPRSIYANSISRTWLRENYDDFWSPEFEALGAQRVTETEVYPEGGNTSDNFGFQSRHNDYRYHPSTVTGDFRINEDDWHYARKFSSTPVLNGNFVSCQPTDRVYLAQETPEVYCATRHSMVARRLVSQLPRNP